MYVQIENIDDPIKSRENGIDTYGTLGGIDMFWISMVRNHTGKQETKDKMNGRIERGENIEVSHSEDNVITKSHVVILTDKLSSSLRIIE